MTEHVCKLEGVAAGYQGESILKGADLRLEPGSITGLLGRNGAGKTTLMRALLGLIETRAGSATLFGEDAYHASAAARQRLGYVPQKLEGLGMRKVREIVYATSSLYENWNAEATNERMQAWQLTDQPMFSLSPGQLQKVAILLALGHTPDLLVLDEPVASLDPAARRAFLQELVEMNVDHDQTVLLSSHITSDVERIASHIAILHDGHIVLHEPLEDLRESVQLLTFTGTVPNNLDVVTRVESNKAWVRSAPRETEGVARRDAFMLEDFFLAVTRQERNS